MKTEDNIGYHGLIGTVLNIVEVIGKGKVEWQISCYEFCLRNSIWAKQSFVMPNTRVTIHLKILAR